MPGKIKVKILAGRNLPVMDRSSDTTDAYVEIKFGNTTYKTDVCRKSLNPQWNSEWYRFEVDDSELQDEPLQLRLMDHDTYSANDAIGKVYINLNPLLLPGVSPPVKNIWTLEATVNSSVGSQRGSIMTGWVPVFDTMHGIRGEVNIIVKVELFLDFNKFRQSSCGVQFFYSPNVPHGYHAQVVHGFVEELIVSDDPEYKWIDKIRTPRASNEARQTLFFKLSGEVQRKIGLKALDLGGNAVIGYLQNFDLEGESGIVARGIGTAVTLVKSPEFPNMLSEGSTVEELITICSKPKKPLESPESDDSIPLLSHSPIYTPNSSPTNIHTTHVSHKFPGYGKMTAKHPKPIMRVTDYRTLEQSRDSVRQIPLSSYSPSFNSRKVGSSLSLSDDIIDEASMRNLLALEDLRGEPGRNRFSRGLRNLKYLQQNVLSKKVTHLKSKMSDSFDEESDADSTYSSSWSIGGSESSRSSVLDLRQNIRKKSFSRSKSSNEGMVALLIKSVHVGFPLDSVKEDRETPTPSPVKFLGDVVDSSKKGKHSEKIGDRFDDQGGKNFGNSSNIGLKYENKYNNNNFSIPMISSSETDTSSEDDEPSESSTNYNILDDSASLNELVLPELEKSVLEIDNKIESIKNNYLQDNSRVSYDKNNLQTFRKDSLQTDRSTSTEPTSSDVDSDFFHDKLERKSKTFTGQLQSKKITLQDENFESGIIFPNQDDQRQNTSTEIENKNATNIESNLEKISNSFKELRDDEEPRLHSESGSLNKIYKHTADKNTNLIGIINEPKTIERNEVIFEDDFKLKRRLNEALFFFGQTGDDGYSNACEIQANIIEAPNTPDFPKPIFKRTEDIKTTEITIINQEEEIELLYMPLLGDENIESTIIIHPELLESLNAPIFSDNKNNDSKISDQKENTEIFNKSFFENNKSNESKTINHEENMEIFNEPFFKDNQNKESTEINKEEESENSVSKNNLVEDHSRNTLLFIDKDEGKSTPIPDNMEINENTLNNLSTDFENVSAFLNPISKPYLKPNESLNFFDNIPNNETKEDSKAVQKQEEVYNLLSSSFNANKNSDSTESIAKRVSEEKSDLAFYSNEPLLSFDTVEDNPNDITQELKTKLRNSQEPFVGNLPESLLNNNLRNSQDNFMNEESELRTQSKKEKMSLVRQVIQYEDSPPLLTEIHFPKNSKSSNHQIISLNENINVSNIKNARDEVLKKEKASNYESFFSHPENLDIPKEKINTKREFVREDKSPRRVERTDTVIYKGPLDEKGRPVTPKVEKRFAVSKQSSANLLPIPIIVEQFSEKNPFLKVPIVHTLDVNVKSTYTKKETELAEDMVHKGHQVEELRNSEFLRHRYRKNCMLDLLKIIDTKMMVHSSHHHKKDSFRCTKKRRDKISKNLTPSPDSIQKIRTHKRKSRSRSPEPHLHGKFPSTSTLNSVHAPSVHSNHHSGKKHAIPSSTQIHNLPLENTFKHNDDSSQVPNGVLSKENLSKSVENPIECEIRKFAATVNKLSTGLKNNNVNNSSANMELRELKSNNVTLSIAVSDVVEPPLQKCPRVCSLKEPVKEQIESTKITNAAVTDNLCVSCPPPPLRQQEEASTSPIHATTNATNVTNSLTSKTPNVTNSKTTSGISLHRRSSDSDLSITPKGNSLAGSDRSMGGYLKAPTSVRAMNQEAMDMLEYPFLTMQQYPPGFILHIGGLVSARSVKLLERISNLEEPEGRDSWWTEIRMEVRSHCRALACNVVIGYKEETSISDDVCVLNASGTAAVINLNNTSQDQDTVFLGRAQQGMAASIDSEREKPQQKLNVKNDKNESEVPLTNQIHVGKVKHISESNDLEIPYSLPLSSCHICHLPYSESSVPFKINVTKCAVCRRAKVPDVLFTTIELPENVPVTGRGCFIQSIVCKNKKDLRGELNAKEISDCLPFLEYELHNMLLNKLKVKGMNAVFGLKVQVSIGERLIIGMAIGTGVYLTALPSPSLPQIASGNSWHNEEQLNEIQKNLAETVRKNRDFYKLKIADVDNGRSRSDTDESDDDLPDLDFSLGTKDSCVLEMDDLEDIDRINLLMDDTPPEDFHVVNTQIIPGLEDLEIVRNLQMFTQVSRAKIPAAQFGSMPSKYFARLLQTVYFKLRRMVPCALCDMRFKVSLPEQDEIQLSVVGMALGLGEPVKNSKHRRKLMPFSSSKDQIKKSDDCDMIFTLDEDSTDALIPTNMTDSVPNTSTLLFSQRPRPRSPLRIKSHTAHRHKHVPLKERYGVDITPLSYLPGGRIERYLGNLNFFFIRESTSIRENGGISGFTHSFMNEVLSIVRAHVTALGGNAMVAFSMTQCVLLHSPHKNHGQCLINVGGDVVSVSYFGDERQTGNTIC